jgi:hypothetical protein
MISFLIVTHENLSNEPDYWNHIVLYISNDDFKTCRKITMYSDLLFDDEFVEFKKRMDCDVITEGEFNKQYWKDDFSTKRYGEYKKISFLDMDTREAIVKCKKCVDRHCYWGCKTYEFLSGRDV